MFSGMRLAQNMVELIQQLRKLRVYWYPGDLESLTTPRLKVATLEDARFHTSSHRDGCLGCSVRCGGPLFGKDFTL